jgi:hypothetical protein
MIPAMAVRTVHVCDQCSREASTPENLAGWGSVSFLAFAPTPARGLPAGMGTYPPNAAPAVAGAPPRSAEVCSLACAAKWLTALGKADAALAREAKAAASTGG